MPTKTTVTVSPEGVQFGSCFVSHEKLTGFSADDLNAGRCSLWVRNYMGWVRAALGQGCETRSTGLLDACVLSPDGQDC